MPKWSRQTLTDWSDKRFTDAAFEHLDDRLKKEQSDPGFAARLLFVGSVQGQSRRIAEAVGALQDKANASCCATILA
jgi:hypothetical protein